MNLKEAKGTMAKKLSWAEMDKSNTPFDKLRTAYAVFNRTVNRSPRTIKWYDDKLILFGRFLGPDAKLRDFGIDSVRAFIADLQGRQERYINNPHHANKEGPLSSSYIQGFARALRAFASWLYEEGYTAENLLKRLKPPKVQQKVVDVLSESDMERLLKTFDLGDPFGARNYAVVFVMLDAGLRVSEACDLTVSNTRLQEGFLRVLGKGNKERLVPLGRRCQEALNIWLERYRPQFAPDADAPCLFLSANGTNLTVRATEEMVARAGLSAGIGKLHPHRLRHTFATRFLTEGLGDTFQLQQLLGHTSLEMVRRYVSLASVERVILDRRPSPLDSIGARQHEQTHVRQVQPRRAKAPRARLKAV